MNGKREKKISHWEMEEWENERMKKQKKDHDEVDDE
jgi:hypothetical protein